MRHIKMYESWLNEAERVMLDQIILKALENGKVTVDKNLVELSKYGKIFESQIRSNLTQLREQYASSSVWSNLGTIAGLETAIENFKNLFFISYGGTSSNVYGTRNPLTGFTVKINNALEILDNDFFEGIKIDNELWRSKAAVNLRDIITQGNNEFARGIAASIIILDLAVAVTNGLYYNSNSLILRSNKTLAEMLKTVVGDSSLSDKNAIYDKFIKLGENSNTFNRVEDIYTHPYSNSIKPEWKGFKVEQNFMQIVPYVQQLSVNFFTDNIGNSADFFSPLFVGNYMFNNANYSIDKAVEFMKAGGPSLLQSAISKFS